MSIKQHSGKEPITRIWALDDGDKIRFYLSDHALAGGLLNHYGDVESGKHRREASLIYFGDKGRIDASAFLNMPIPDYPDHPHRPEFLDFCRDKSRVYTDLEAAWKDFVKSVETRKNADKQVLAQRIIAYREAAANNTQRPSPVPWTEFINRRLPDAA